MRTEFYNQWASAVHHSEGKQLKAEIFEIDELPTASSSSDKQKAASGSEKAIAIDKHLP